MSQTPDTANKGLENIVACTSEISTIHDVTLLYRGYTIEDLAANCSFEETVFLLWNGRLPTTKELGLFQKDLRKNLILPDSMRPLIEIIAKTHSHPMSKLRTAVSYFGCLDTQAEDISSSAILAKSARLTGALPTMAAWLSCAARGKKLLSPNIEKSIAWNFLTMVRNQEPSSAEERLFDTALVLHADHELNASAFTARVVSSTTSDYYSAVTAAIGSLKGPLHGGANEAVMLMLKEIGSMKNIDAFIEDAVSNKKKVMGIGHRVYKNGDPRAKILKEMSLETCRKSGLEEQHQMLVKIQTLMEEKKGLMPNVDFYSGLVYTALKLEPKDFTPIFAVSRIAGWSAQVMEQYSNNRIYRPRAFYTGPINLKTTPIERR